jgi:hypothetical protein
VQEGGVVMTVAVDYTERQCTVAASDRARYVGETATSLSRKIEPRRRPERLLTALVSRDGSGPTGRVGKPRFLDLAMTHACLVNPL